MLTLEYSVGPAPSTIRFASPKSSTRTTSTSSVENETTIVIIITDLEFGEWVSVFGYAKMTTAVFDRVTHH